MNSKERREEIELLHLKEFIERYGLPNKADDFRRGIPGNEPDFVYRDLGIEVTTLVDSDIMAKENLHNRICQLAEKKYMDEGLPPVSVHATLPDSVRKRDVSFYATKLFQIVKENPLQEESQISIDSEQSERFISIRIAPRRYPSSWQAGSVEMLKGALEKIQKRITAKNRKLPRYRKNLSKVWLLLVEGSWSNTGEPRLACQFLLQEDVDANAFSSDFDRVFILSVGRFAKELDNEERKKTAI